MPEFSPKNIHQNYIPELDGLRGIAILLVISMHYLGVYFAIFSLGWTGVDLFFVLSGYLITSRLIDTLNTKKYFSGFYKNRALRILPLYYGVLICFYFTINFIVSPRNRGGFEFYNEHKAAFFLFFENWFFINKDLIENHLLHFWSLAVEEQFYLIWPFVIFFFYKTRHFIKVLIALIFVILIYRILIYYQISGLQSDCQFNTICKMDSFIIGALLYFISIDKLKKIARILFPLSILLIIGGIMYSGTQIKSEFMATIGYTALAVFYANCIFFSIQRKSKRLTLILNQQWLIYIGKISYGLYIYHWIIFMFLYSQILKYLHNSFFLKEWICITVGLLTCFILSLLVSTISYYYYELYFLKLKRR